MAAWQERPLKKLPTEASSCVADAGPLMHALASSTCQGPGLPAAWQRLQLKFMLVVPISTTVWHVAGDCWWPIDQQLRFAFGRSAARFRHCSKHHVMSC